MRIIALIFCLLLVGCVTKKKAVEIAKTEIDQKESISDIQESTTDISTQKESSSLTAYDFGQIMGKWAINYDGDVGDGFRFYMNQTENGWEAGAEGKGTATAKSETVNTNYKLGLTHSEKHDSIASILSNRIFELESKLEAYEKNKLVEKESTGLQAGAYIGGTILLIVLILLFWLGWKLRKLGQSVQAFMNFKNLLKDD